MHSIKYEDMNIKCDKECYIKHIEDRLIILVHYKIQLNVSCQMLQIITHYLYAIVRGHPNLHTNPSHTMQINEYSAGQHYRVSINLRFITIIQTNCELSTAYVNCVLLL